jgi:ATP-binding cassette subfamily B multidrug efflux pump
MDRIVVLERGRIAEEGTHLSLLDQGCIHASLWHKQSGRFLAVE